ncbi:hypothetical protein [Azohydromonas caseinilytica]|uniref:Uncharacterized protein n=1 Tax=Azohydromonas caseinilytica TaxID=2728836 RepID=A0A848FFQ7_9BURK|nr:hypothetical protein [Azohydromonas caseinilytica]NML18268.1 hypothetical protein [Azohydromonas caseinilytica]
MRGLLTGKLHVVQAAPWLFSAAMAGAAASERGTATPDERVAMEGIEIFRGVERLIVVLFGGASIYFGYKLFEKAYQEFGELTAEAAGNKLSIKRVGPGVFFASFGMLILVTSLSYPLKRVVEGKDNSGAEQQNTVANGQAFQSTSIYARGGIISGRETRLRDALFGAKFLKKEILENSVMDQNSKNLAGERIGQIESLLQEELYGAAEIEKFRETRGRILQNSKVYQDMSPPERARYDDMLKMLED